MAVRKMCCQSLLSNWNYSTKTAQSVANLPERNAELTQEAFHTFSWYFDCSFRIETLEFTGVCVTAIYNLIHIERNTEWNRKQTFGRNNLFARFAFYLWLLSWISINKIHEGRNFNLHVVKWEAKLDGRQVNSKTNKLHKFFLSEESLKKYLYKII